MTTLNRRIGSALALSLSGALWIGAPTAHAQNAVTTSGEGRFQVELRDASLADALEMIFKAAGNPPHQIDATAQGINIGFVTFPSIRFESLLLNLTRANNFRVVKDPTGTYIITPRTPPPVEFSGEGGSEGAPPAFGFPAPPTGGAGVPTNPFGRRNVAEPQISPFGRGGASSANDDKQYRPIRVLHLSASGIAQLFGGTIITTENFLGVGNTGGGGSGGGGGFGGGFGGSGFGATSVGGGSNNGGGDTGGFGGGDTGGSTGGDIGGGGGFGGGGIGGVGGDTGGSNGVGF